MKQGGQQHARTWGRSGSSVAGGGAGWSVGAVASGWLGKQPAAGAMAKGGQATARSSASLAGRRAAMHGDHAPRPDGPSLSVCMNFKAPVKTK